MDRQTHQDSLASVGKTCAYEWLLVTQLCLTLHDPMDYSPPGSSVHGISQARILEWIAIPFSKGYSLPKSPALLDS